MSVCVSVFLCVSVWVKYNVLMSLCVPIKVRAIIRWLFLSNQIDCVSLGWWDVPSQRRALF